MGSDAVLTAEFREIPERHDGLTEFAVRILFSADISSLETLEKGVQLTRGTRGRVIRVAGRSDLWHYPVTPTGNRDVVITLPVASGCTTDADICSSENFPLATALVGRVAGPASIGGDEPRQPSPPTNFKADPLDGAVRLRWRAPIFDGGSPITGHWYRAREQYFALPKPWRPWTSIPDSTPGGQNGESFTVTEDMQNEKVYEFQLRARNSLGTTLADPRTVFARPQAGELPFDFSLTPSPADPEVVAESRAFYTVTFEGHWDIEATPGGVPSDAHFSRLVGGVHNGSVVFVEHRSLTTTSAGIESMAETGGTATLKAEIVAAGDDHLSVLEGAANILPTGSESLTDVTLTAAHPRVTLLTMVAPSPDWFVGVSGLSMLDSLGGWRQSRTVELHPFDAGTEDGTGFSLTNDDTDPHEQIESLLGKGKFSAEPIATLTFERATVPAAPTDLTATAGERQVILAWMMGGDGGSPITKHQYRVRGGSYTPIWRDIPDSAAGGVNATGFTVVDVSTGVYNFDVRAVNAVGEGPEAMSGAVTPFINRAPTFTGLNVFSPGENQTAVGTVQASDPDAGDEITGYAIDGGADGHLFSIGSATGVLTFKAPPNFEDPMDAGTDNSYVVGVQATSGTGDRVKTATLSITVTVTDAGGEAPSAPSAPSVEAASASSLNVSWTAPGNAGPRITDYNVRYRAGTSGAWTDFPHSGAGVTANITGLLESTSYQVQVQATNAEGTSGWSPSGSGATDANAAPTFDSATTFDAAENQTAVGTVEASDSDTGDDITSYVLSGGADQSFFSIGSDTGVLTFKAAPNFEAPSDADTNGGYVVTVQATSGTGDREQTATQTITVTVTDDDTEAPSAPDAPSVEAASVTSLNVSWTAPDNAGPEITDYDYRYRTSSPVGAWVEVTSTTTTATSATIESLAESKSYEVQVRATNDEGTSGWSPSGSGATDANAAPSFTSSTTFDPQENQTAVGTVRASDNDTGDDITGYVLSGGADQSFFSIDRDTGVLTFKAAPNYEDPSDAEHR